MTDTPTWLRVYAWHALAMAHASGRVTPSSVRDACPLPTHGNRKLVGPVWSGLRSRGLLRPSGGATRSTAPSRHRSAEQVWVVADRRALARWFAEHPQPPSSLGATLWDLMVPGGDA